ncbi:MAG: hypothetical protein ACXADU_05840 [Promethearchaeota archaeon]|jgi:DNA repair exonuclease SbcCD ATPase subunit
MSNEEERKEEENLVKERRDEEREKSKVRWELSDIRDDLKYELDDLYDDLKDEIDDLKDEADDIKDELRDEIEEVMEERESLLDEVGDVRGELEKYGDDAVDHIEKAREKLERLKLKIEKHEEKFKEKVQKKVEKAKKKAARINISVDPDMSDEWKDWADGLGASVSELVRKSMKFVKNNIGDLAKLEAWGKEMEKLGENIERSAKKSGLEELGKKFEKELGGQKVKIKSNIVSDRDRIIKRVNGLIKLHNSLPIDKLAQAIGRSREDAENLVYELAAEGIEGTLEEGVFKFTSTPEEVITKLNELIGKM